MAQDIAINPPTGRNVTWYPRRTPLPVVHYQPYGSSADQGDRHHDGRFGELVPADAARRISVIVSSTRTNGRRGDRSDG